MTKPVIEVAFCDGCGKHLDDHRWIEGDDNLIYDPLTNSVFHPLCFAGKHLAAYAIEMSWRENARRVPNGSQFAMVVGAATAAPKSLAWCGYWQR